MKRLRLCDHSSKNDECLRDSTFDLAKAKAKLKKLTPREELPEFSGYQPTEESGDQEKLNSLPSLSGYQATDEQPISPKHDFLLKSFSGYQLSEPEIPVSEKPDLDAVVSDEDKKGTFL